MATCFLNREEVPTSKEGNSTFYLKIKVMALQLSSQHIDGLIQSVESITQNRCSLSDEDRNLLREVIVTLKRYKRKRISGDAASLLLIVRAVELLSKFFV